jgi:hypothetical protein
MCSALKNLRDTADIKEFEKECATLAFVSLLIQLISAESYSILMLFNSLEFISLTRMNFTWYLNTWKGVHLFNSWRLIVVSRFQNGSNCNKILCCSEVVEASETELEAW